MKYNTNTPSEEHNKTKKYIFQKNRLVRYFIFSHLNIIANQVFTIPEIAALNFSQNPFSGTVEP